MTVKEFDKKWEEYQEEGHYGLAIYDKRVTKYLDKEFTKEIKVNASFSFSQIKLKFGTSRVYANSEKTSIWENKINKILNENKN